MTARSAILWMTHVWNRELEAEFEKILEINNHGSYDVWLLLDSSTPGSADLVKQYEHCHVFNVNEMCRRLSYPRTNPDSLYNQVHFPVLDFYLGHQEYDFYWIIEFDVRYTGRWESLLHSFDPYDHDLITSHIRHFSNEPDWYWWDSFRHPSKEIRQERFLRSFNVIYRLSNRALHRVHCEQQDGWQGHPEVLIPTLLDNQGYTLLDFGGNGGFSLPESKNSVYTSGSTRDGIPNPFCTMRWKPARARAGIRKNKLYHPVKPLPMVEPSRTRMDFIARWIWRYICEIILKNDHRTDNSQK